MKEILYQVKRLDKVIARNLLGDISGNICTYKPSSTQIQIVHYILEHLNEDIYQRDLENVLKLRRATVSGVLKTMEKNGLIIRKVCNDDTRAKKIYLNDKTKDMFINSMKKIEELEEIAICGISSDELDIFLNVIGKMRKNIENATENK